MVLNDIELLRILKTNPQKETITEARKRAKLNAVHITGEGLAHHISRMEYFEDEQKKNMRQKYARSSKDLFGRLHQPINKVFSAKGGSIIYNLPEKQTSEMADYLGKIRNGMSLRKWVKSVALPAFQVDPMGLIYMEINEEGNPYPTYKSTSCIFDYGLNGRMLSYVIFELTKTEVLNFINQGVEIDVQSPLVQKLQNGSKRANSAKYYRVVDDMTDRVVEYNNKEFTTIEELTIMNPFYYVPGLVVSDLVNFNSALFASPDDLIIEVANDFLTDCSVFNIWKKLHGFPKAWRFRSTCNTCQGNKTVSGIKCPDCDGTGHRKTSSVRDEIVIPMPEGKDNVLPTAFAGYVTPDIDGWGMMTEELDRLERLMTVTMWGTQTEKTDDAKQDTALGELVDSATSDNALKPYSEWAESVETFVIRATGQVLFNPNYDGPAVKYGDRYIIEKPDTIWKKYADARKGGAPQATLDGLLRDYFESRYNGSPLDLQKALTLMQVEPWTHLTIDQVVKLPITNEDKATKLYFSEWISTKKDMEILSTKVEKLRDDLRAYAAEKATAIDTEMKAQAEHEAQTQATAKGGPAPEGAKNPAKEPVV